MSLKSLKELANNIILVTSLTITSYSHFNFPLPQPASVAGHRRAKFQVAKMWNSLFINLRAVSDLIEFWRDLRLHLLGWGVGVLSCWTVVLACLGQSIPSQAMVHLATSSLPWMSSSFLYEFTFNLSLVLLFYDFCFIMLLCYYIIMLLCYYVSYYVIKLLME